ncbi:hypothetical protein IWW36_001474 [Coemansia brasiliensis]|uniref:Uncharacterized protein n=1 Tax=Coemansia brasiliensis TaxID=2650707 RepID=A0A9W8IGL8_9FUNG|nr:hypothetical protein IWW36_001474 [Coemansia brasiliensis]
MSHFEQEPFMFQCLPSGHEHEEETGKESTKDSEGEEKTERQKMEEQMRLEERASQRWLRDRRVLLRVIQNLQNRNRRWDRGQPSQRIYLPPVPLDSMDADIKEEWQGPVKLIKMKAGLIAVVYKRGRSIRLWNVATNYEKVKEMTASYIEQNRSALAAHNKSNGSVLPPFTDAQVESLLRCSKEGEPQKPTLSVIRSEVMPYFLDFYFMNNTLVTSNLTGQIDVFDMKTGKKRRRLELPSLDPVNSIHVWLQFVIVSHGSRLTLWNHVTGELLEDGLQTAHKSRITGVFILDDERHLLSIDEHGIMVVTNRTAANPSKETLMDVPLYPLILTGTDGAPYSMRLLHMTHLCVWGKYSMGHFELYEPGLRNMPPLSSLIMVDENNQPVDPQNHPLRRLQQQQEQSPQTNSEDNQQQSQTNSRESQEETEAQQALRQLTLTHENLEIMYSQMGLDTDMHSSASSRLTRLRQNHVPPEQRYHILNIDTSIDGLPEGQILSVDFKHVLLQRRCFMQICDLDVKIKPGEMPQGPSLGIFPVDPVGPRLGPKKATDVAEGTGSDYEINWDLGEGDSPLEDSHREAERLRQQPQPNVSKADLYQLETLTTRYLMGMQVAREDFRFAQLESNKILLQRGREFMEELMPELLEAIDNDEDPQAVIFAAPYYAQRAHEAKFDKPVMLVDHRGQPTTSQRLCADMQRIHRVVNTNSKSQQQMKGGIIPPAVSRLRLVTAAMDDGQIAVGCENGYVVVTSFN